jgi:predicted metalloprotease
MKFDPSDRSSNVEVRRGGVGTMGGIGIGGLIIAIIGAFMGIDPSALINMTQQAGPSTETVSKEPLNDEQAFLANVLGTTEKVWGKVFQQQGATYTPPKLVVYEGATRTACGVGQTAMGPFYCPEDEHLYIDLAFMRELKTRFRAPGDFAQGYVVAHEVGHHVQKLTGAFRQLEAAKATGNRSTFNRTSVAIELQADCYAGVWANHAGTMGKLDAGDIEEGLAAAAAVGDDRLQKQATGRVSPDSFTHGSSAQRTQWFTRGYQSGNPGACETSR